MGAGEEDEVLGMVDRDELGDEVLVRVASVACVEAAR